MGYKVVFSCPMVSGGAVLVPYNGLEERLVPGVVLSVETSQEKVTDFKIVSDPRDETISKMDQHCDYKIVGTVCLNSEDEVFYIDVGDFTFTLDVEETGGIKPKKNDKVEFSIHCLTLWDENI